MDVQAVVPQGSILGSLFSLIYISDSPDNLTSNPKLFADDTLLFSSMTDPNATVKKSRMIYITLAHGLTNGSILECLSIAS